MYRVSYKGSYLGSRLKSETCLYNSNDEGVDVNKPVLILLFHTLISESVQSTSFSTVWVACIFISMFTIIVVLILMGVLFLAYLNRIKNSRFDKYLSQFPGPKPYPIVGNSLQLGSTLEILPKLMEYREKYGEIFKLQLGPFERSLVISGYEHVEHFLKSNHLIVKADAYRYLHNWIGLGLINNTGEKWRKHRKLITPAFHFHILEQFIEVFNNSSEILIEKLNEQVDKEPFDIYPYITLCSLDIVCESTMGTSVNAQRNSNSEYVKCTQQMGRIIIERMFSAVKSFDLLYPFTQDYKIERKALKVIHDYSNSVIVSRRNQLIKNKSAPEKIKRLAFLDLLLHATIDGKSLSDADIRAEVDTFLFAGHDTTSSAISFTLYCLAKYPEIQKLAVEEQLSIFESDLRRVVTHQDLQNMKYLELVIKETMRLFPTVPFITRKIHEDVEYNGQILPEGLTILILLWGIHKDPKYYPEPGKFDPERFRLENNHGQYPFSYVPFSAGPRNCIGQRFAMLEMKSVVSKILKNFIVLPPVPEQKLILASETILKSDNGILISLKKRKF